MSIQFDFDQYPTLLQAQQSRALFDAVIGPAGCLPGDCEVMTPTGWRRFDSMHPGEKLIAGVYDLEREGVVFEVVEAFVTPSTGFYTFSNAHALRMRLSDQHRIIGKTSYSSRREPARWFTHRAGVVAEHLNGGTSFDFRIPTAGMLLDAPELPMSDAEIRLRVAIAADGHLPERGYQTLVTVRKERKKARLRSLLMELGIQARESTYDGRPTETTFAFTTPWPRTKDLHQLYGVSGRQVAIIAEELLLWDGSIYDKGRKFSTSREHEADFAQWVYVLAGQHALKRTTRHGASKGHSPMHEVRVQSKGVWSNMRTLTSAPFVPPAPGEEMFCLHTRTGAFMVRDNGHVFMTGNSAKTSGIIAMLLVEAMMQTPFMGDPAYPGGVRETRTIVARQSYQQLAKATVGSLRNVLGTVGHFSDGKPPSGLVEFPLPDGTTVRWEFLFQALESDSAEGDLRGMEATNAFIDELSEITDPALVQILISRLGRFPSAIRGGCRNRRALGATNGPLEGHWLHRWSLGEKKAEFDAMGKQMGGRPYFRLHRQPPALLRPEEPGGEWRPNNHAENVVNLPDGYGYYFAMLGMGDQAIQAFVEGDFARLQVGKRVITAFNRKLHVIPREMFDRVWRAGNLVTAHDFGRTPVALLAVERADGGLIIIDSFMDSDTSFDAFLHTKVLPGVRQKYPNSRLIGGTGDPSGADESAATSTSPFEIALAAGLVLEYPGGTRVDRLQPRLEATQQRLQRLSPDGVPMIQITDNNTELIDALERTYVWKTLPGQTVGETPTKSHALWCSDLADAFQYLCWWKANELANPRMASDDMPVGLPLIAG